MTDREASEWYFRAYEKPSVEELAKRQEEINQDHAEKFEAMDIDEKRKAHEELCKANGVSEAAQKAAWKQYLETGKM